MLLASFYLHSISLSQYTISPSLLPSLSSRLFFSIILSLSPSLLCSHILSFPFLYYSTCLSVCRSPLPHCLPLSLSPSLTHIHTRSLSPFLSSLSPFFLRPLLSNPKAPRPQVSPYGEISDPPFFHLSYSVHNEGEGRRTDKVGE